MAPSATSTIGAAPKRIQVRDVRWSAPLQAYQLTEETSLSTADGFPTIGFPTDWVVSRNGQVVDVLKADAFARYYQEVQEGQLVIPPEQRFQLQEALGEGTTETVDHLVTAVRRVARLKIADVHIKFTPPQLEEIARRAARNGKSTKDYLKMVVHQFVEGLWAGSW